MFLTHLGLLYIRLNQHYKAFDSLGNALTYNSLHIDAILAAGSIIQTAKDYDVALMKYRIAAIHTPNSSELWNNIAMCFYGKKQYISAHSCLQRAIHLNPFEWKINYNLGLLYVHTGQYASAFHYLSSALSYNAKNELIYMYLAITLSYLDDFEHAEISYQKAIELHQDTSNPILYFNYAISLYKHKQFEKAKQYYAKFCQLYVNDDQILINEKLFTNQYNLNQLKK